MMATILNSSILNSAILDSAILHKTLTQTSSIWLKLIHSDSTWWWQPSWILPSWIQTLPSWIWDTLLSSLRFTQKHSHSTFWLWLKLIQSDIHSFWLNLMMAVILKSAILDSAILVFSLKLTHTCHLLHKKNFTHSFWLNLMMAAILNSAMLDSDTAILDSDTLLSSLRFTQKHSPSTLTLTQTNSIWLTNDDNHLEFCHIDSAILHKTLTQTKSDSNSFILTQLDDGSHPEFCYLGFRHCHLGFRHLVIFSQIDSKTLSLHSDSDSN